MRSSHASRRDLKRAAGAASSHSPLLIAAALAVTALLSFTLGAVWVGGQTKVSHRLRKRFERVPKCAPTCCQPVPLLCL